MCRVLFCRLRARMQRQGKTAERKNQPINMRNYRTMPERQ